MTSTALIGTFNVNQFDSVAHQRADLLKRMSATDRLFLQETVDLDLAAFVVDPVVIAAVGEWGAVQVRRGADDGHANTAILYRLDMGIPTATECFSIGKAPDTRERFLTAAEFPDGWCWSAHIFPARDTAQIAAELAKIGAWVKAHPGPSTGGLDRNQCSVADLEHATGLTWRGVGIDGFLTNLPIADVASFAKGFSDHTGVSGVLTINRPPVAKPKRTYVQRASVLLREALHVADAHGRQEKATRLRRALAALVVVPPKPRHVFPAIGAARAQSANGPAFGVGLCLQRVRMCFGIPALAADATGAWNIAAGKHRTTDPASIPRGVPVFWTGGSHGHGHIAIATGNGRCWSTDIHRPGFFDNVPISEIHERWGLTLVGWATDLNGRPIDVSS